MVVLPRFAETPFCLLATPAPLLGGLVLEYPKMVFKQIEKTTRHHRVWQADVIDGISSVRYRIWAMPRCLLACKSWPISSSHR